MTFDEFTLWSVLYMPVVLSLIFLFGVIGRTEYNESCEDEIGDIKWITLVAFIVGLIPGINFIALVLLVIITVVRIFRFSSIIDKIMKKK